MNMMFFVNRIVLTLLIAILVGCAAPQNIVQPTPHFGWESPVKSRSNNVNLALVSPNFSSHSNFGSYKGNRYLKTYLNSFQTDLQAALIAKGFSVTGPYDDFDMMTYPNKKVSNLALVPELILNIDENHTNTFSNDDGSYFKKEGKIHLNGFIRFTLLEPISEEKMWIKKINLPEQEEPISVDMLYTTPDRLNSLHANKDNRDAALVDMLNRIYPEVMKKFWNYLNDEEIKMIVKASKGLRAKKRY